MDADIKKLSDTAQIFLYPTIEAAREASGKRVRLLDNGQNRIDYYGFSGESHPFVCVKCGSPSRDANREVLFQLINDGRMMRVFRCECGQVQVIEATGPMWKLASRECVPTEKAFEVHS